MGKYFGTDGVRGVANGDLTPEDVERLERALARFAALAAGTIGGDVSALPGAGAAGGAKP